MSAQLARYNLGMETAPAPDPRPLVQRVEELHRKAKAAGLVLPPKPPRERLPLDLPPERRDLN